MTQPTRHHDPEAWRRVQELFHAALDHDPSERDTFLEEACRRDAGLLASVRKLLEAETRASGFFARTPVVGEDATPFRLAEPVEPPPRLGGFTILDVIAHGGMGVVYRARQDHPSRVVALKVMRGGLSRTALARFELEARILGHLRHPGIAQIHDAGVHDDLAWFAMELIEGPTLGDYLEHEDLERRQRLELLVRICEAVQHAHHKGVIHRDLKPSNVLVDTGGQPKIVDFGIARATTAELRRATLQTDAGLVLGTLAYMSPEQAAGPEHVDTRTDVYSLGVILFQLLAGRLPHDLTGRPLAEALRIIREVEPPRLGQIDRSLRGDLEVIAGKALAKEPGTRYGSPADLAADITRHLRHEPILARPLSRLGLLVRFARRHKTFVTAASIVFLALSTATVVSSLAAKRAQRAQEKESRQRREAERAEKVARSMNEAFRRVLLATSPDQGMGRDTKVIDVVESWGREVARTFADRPLNRLQACTLLGSTYRSLGFYDHARDTLETAVEAGLEVADEGHKDVIIAMMELSRTLEALGETDEALALARKVFSGSRRLDGSHRLIVGDASLTLAYVLAARGDLEEAERILVDLIATPPQSISERAVLGLAQRDLAWICDVTGRVGRARELLTQARESYLRAYGPDHPAVLGLDCELVSTLMHAGFSEEASRLAEETLDEARESRGEDHRQTLALRRVVVLGLLETGRYAEGLELARDLLRDARRVWGDDHVNVIRTHVALAHALYRLGRFEAAEVELEEVIDACEDVLRATHHVRVRAIELMSRVLIELERPEEALELSGEQIAACREARAPLTVHLVNLVRAHAHALIRCGRRAEAQESLEGLLGTLEKRPEIDGLTPRRVLNDLAAAHYTQGHVDEAVTLMRRLLKRNRNDFGEAHPRTISSLNNLGLALLESGRAAEAEPMLRRSVELSSRHEPAGSWRSAHYRQALARCLARLSRREEAEREFRKALAALESSFPADHAYVRKVLEELAALYEAWGKPAEAARCRRRLSGED